MGWRIGIFCPNWAFNSAKVGSKTSPKSEVEAIDSLVKNEKAPAAPGLSRSQTWLRKKGVSAEKKPQPVRATYSAMNAFSN